LASRRRRRKSIGKVVSDVERRLRVTEKRPGAKRIRRNVITSEKIQYRAIVAKNVATDGITPNEVSFGTTVITDTEPTDYLKEGTTWVNPNDGATKVYDPAAEDFVTLSAIDFTARASADGKNTIYRQNAQPTGGTYVTGDTWFDEDDGNKLYRYNGTTWVAFTLGNSALASISASKITAGTIDASVITVSNLDAGNITTGSLSASRIAANTITAAMISATALDAKTITGSTIQTSAAATSRVILDASGLRAVDSSGNTKVNIATNGSITAEAGTIGGFSLSAQYLQGSGNIRMNADTGIITCASINASGILLNGTFSGGANAMNNIGALGAASISTTGNISSGGDLTSTGELRAIFGQANPSTSAPNVFMSSSGQVRRTTGSSTRYKENITDLLDVAELDPKRMLQIPVRAFSYKSTALGSQDDRSGVLIPGLIAEEVDAIYPLATDYQNGDVENINDRAILVNLLALVQDLYKEIALLKEA
jgi:hypothetical protein